MVLVVVMEVMHVSGTYIECVLRGRAEDEGPALLVLGVGGGRAGEDLDERLDGSTEELAPRLPHALVLVVLHLRV